MLDYSQLPESVRGATQRWIEHSIPPGSFLEAVLKNDLKQACMHADHVNRYLIFGIVSWFYNEAPPACWGSLKNYQEWAKRRKN